LLPLKKQRIVWRMPQPLSRREILQRCAALGLLVASSSFAGAVADAFADAERATRAPTPSNALGPFYRRGAPAINDLRGTTDPGLPLLVAGAIFDTRGEARPDATVEVWQADHLGHYDIEGFRYRATLATDAKGGYQFTSVMPGHYPDRVAQHVHYMVKAPGCKPLVTQLYFATDPVFEGDPEQMFSKDPLVQSRELVRPVLLTGDPKDPMARVTFELCLERL
jgi:protocatechuate 3,4-dioxygenase beta subunit